MKLPPTLKLRAALIGAGALSLLSAGGGAWLAHALVGSIDPPPSAQQAAAQRSAEKSGENSGA